MTFTIENIILISARKAFLLYGYYGTTIQSIASDAKVNKTSIHYYFRSKEKLYQRVIDEVAEIILNCCSDSLNQNDIIWFVINEMRNNKELFINSLNNSAKADWEININKFVSIALAEKSHKEIMCLLKFEI